MKPVPERDAELEALLERFLAEPPADAEAFLRAHPEHADELRHLLVTIGELDAAGRRLAAERPVLPPASLDGPLGLVHGNDFVASALERIGTHGSKPGRFRAEQELARGGQGTVLAAWDEALQRRLAMKVALAPTHAADGTPSSAVSLGRFLEEAQVTAQLDHPGIVPVHDLGLDEAGRVFFTMKLVKGRDLRAILELVRRGEEGWNRTRALGVLLKVCEAMAYAHSKGMIHRDLKPANVMVGKFGEVYVMDWGLARVLGREDRKDLRIAPEAGEPARSPRPEPSAVDSPLLTMDGDVVGTPAFMSPEQARGELAAMGPHSDVYAVGAMLYQLLTGRMPYASGETRLSPREIWARVQAGPPEPVHVLARDVPAELAAICDKAMARDVARRYADMSALAEDLRAYLEQRVVRAHQTGALVELRKWVQRNRGLAAALALGALVTLIGLASSLALKARSDANAARAERERADVLRLSALQKVADLENEAEALWPPWPRMQPAYDDWLARAQGLLVELEPDPATGAEGHRARLTELEARALPYSEAERNEDRRAGTSAELSTLQAELAALRRAQAVREGRERVEEPLLEEGLHSAPSLLLDSLAWQRITPDRTSFGEEARGLALARLAVERGSASPLDHAIHLRTLSWALEACGLDQEALATGQRAVDTAPEEFGPVFRWDFQLLRNRLEPEACRTAMAGLEQRIAELEAEASKRRTWRFESTEDRWWHAQQQALIARLEALADPEQGLIRGISPEHGWGVERRRDWARRLAALGDDEQQGRRWEEALRSIADPAECPAYEGLRLEREPDLVPLGRDPRSGLWEFVQLLTGTIPVRDERGDLIPSGEMGVVLVLIPGGKYLMGAQRQDPAAPNYDPEAATDNAVCEKTVAPFFLSKYEMTQGQWYRLTGLYPSYYNPSFFTGWYFTAPITDRHPVEKVSWLECVEVCRRVGLTLPTEVQWEYAARAGTTTIWPTGNERESLIGAANLADRSIGRFPEVYWLALADWPEFEDGHPAHAPVGSFAPNRFGLHDVCGNLQEWCLNAYDASNTDPTLEPNASRSPALRDSAFQFGSSLNHSARRQYAPAEWASHTLGLRPAREARVRNASEPADR